jgi:hypothetical protein
MLLGALAWSRAAAADDCAGGGDCAPGAPAPPAAPAETPLPGLPVPAGEASGVRAPSGEAPIGRAPLVATQAPAVSLTTEQLETLSDIVDDRGDHVLERLRLDPGLTPMAIEAIDAHDQRKSAGKALLVTGIVILVATDIAAVVIIATTPNYPFIESNQGWAQLGAGLAVGVAGAAVGLAFGIPGVIKLAKHSDEETRLVEHYRPSSDSPSAAPAPPVSLNGAFRVPLVALSF